MPLTTNLPVLKMKVDCQRHLLQSFFFFNGQYVYFYKLDESYGNDPQHQFIGYADEAPTS